MVPENTPPKTAVLRPLLSKPDDQSTKYLVAMWTMVLQNHPSTGWGLADRYLRSYRAWCSFSRPNLKMRISVPYCQTRHQTCEKKKGPVQNHNSNPSSTARRSVGLCLLSNRASKLLLHSVGQHFHQKRTSWSSCESVQSQIMIGREVPPGPFVWPRLWNYISAH